MGMISSSQRRILGVSLGKVWRPVFKSLRVGAYGLIGKSARPFPGPSRNLRGLAMSIENLPGEEWRPVVGYESLYSVSNMGRVKGHARMRHIGNQWHTDAGKMAMCGKDRILIGSKHFHGYIKVTLCHSPGMGSKYKQVFVHRLIAEAFCKNSDPDKSVVVNHINGDKSDNRSSNLEWCTQQHNCIHGHRVCTNAILADIEASRKFGPVDIVFRDGKVVRTPSLKEACVLMGVLKNRHVYESTKDVKHHPWSTRNTFFFRKVRT